MKTENFYLTGAQKSINCNPIEDLTSVLDLMYPLQEQIRQVWEEFVNHNDGSLHNPNIREQIAHSWIRSRNHGISADDPLAKRVKSSTWKNVLRDSKTLIDVATPILNDDLAFIKYYSDFSACLFDCHGITLLPVNCKKTPNSIYLDAAGLDQSEETVGTSSHSMSLFLDKPMLLIGPENFNRAIQNVSAAVSVPIHNRHENIAGVLTFFYHKHNDLYLTSREMFSGMIAFQRSLVKKIESALKMADSQYFSFHDESSDISQRNQILFNTVHLLTDDCLIAVNKHGNILNMNSHAKKLLGADNNQFQGKHISSIMGEKAQLLNAVATIKSTGDFPTQILSNGRKKDCLIRIVPVDKEGAAITSLIRIKLLPTNSLKDFHALYTFDDIIGDSPEIINAKQLAQKFANTPRNILLLGESGTGKELFAHSIHNASRPQGPFITINCASLPKGLIESELFGYEGGSFTGADRKGRVGKLEMADGGTLFLDEIGDMPIELQPVLLRVLEEKRVMRIGGNRYIPTNFRIIAATNKDLNELIMQNLFREDLYYRLSSLEIVIPALKNRRKDIPLLTRHFIQKQCHELCLPLPTIEPSIYKALLCYDWPGNIRELQNVVSTALSLAENKVIKKTDLPSKILTNIIVNHQIKNSQTIYQTEKQAINDALINTNGNIHKAATSLGISRYTLYRKMKKYNIFIDKPDPSCKI